MSRRILFVCTGNTCRSPMAEALGRQLLPADKFSSAGLSALPNEPAAANAVEVLRLRGLEMGTHRARALSEETLNESDLVLCMTVEHRLALATRFPLYVQRTHTLREFVGLEPADVKDPFGGGIKDYQSCFEALEESLRLLRGRKQTL